MEVMRYYAGTWLSANGYVQSGSLTYDSKNHRYINAAVANDGTWFVAYATISGTTESSIDHVTSEGKLGRLIIVRTSNTRFASTGYPSVSDGKAFFKANCQKK
jgi:hypothetical protein